MKIKRAIKYFFQRVTRGWDDSDTWSLDDTAAAFILPRLRRFKQVQNGRPYDIPIEQWEVMLDKMIAAFEFTVSKDRYLNEVEGYKKHQEGLDLFAKYFWNLWW